METCIFIFGREIYFRGQFYKERGFPFPVTSSSEGNFSQESHKIFIYSLLEKEIESEMQCKILKINEIHSSSRGTFRYLYIYKFILFALFYCSQFALKNILPYYSALCQSI